MRDTLRITKRRQGAILHYLQLAIECVIDIGELLISEFKLRKANEMHEVIEILGESKILPSDFAKRFAQVAGLRNILVHVVHEYADVDLEIVYEHLKKDLKDFDFFAQCIAKFVKSQSAG